MKIARFRDRDGRLRWGVPAGEGRARPLAGGLFDGPPAPSAETIEIAELLAPLDPVNIFCIGKNYAEHARETGAEIPERPVVFMKPTSSVTGPGRPIRIPASCEHGPEVDYEGELAVVIGRPARDVAPERALAHVLGYTCANDVTARRWQKHAGGGQWVRGKGFDSFCPLGPWIVTTDELADPQALAIETRVNGHTVQSASTGAMVFPVAFLVSYLSRDTTLLAGTVILTGTPAGVGFTRQPPLFLAPGDRVAVEIAGIGILENSVAGP